MCGHWRFCGECQRHVSPLVVYKEYSSWESFFGIKLKIWHMARGRHSLVEVDSFLGELAWSVLGVLIRLILDHLHPLPTFTLFMAVFTDHIQLADPVLKNRQETNKQRKPHFRLIVSSKSREMIKAGRKRSPCLNGKNTWVQRYTRWYHFIAGVKINAEG